MLNISQNSVAKKIEQAGASAICIHPRTRAQGYSGHSDWNIIKQVKESVSIPVIGNEDIKTIYDAKKMLDETKCDAIMIGRATLGNPWFIKECIEYVIIHELCHLEHYHHGPEFYQLLERFLPDWEKRKYKLEIALI